MTIYHRSRSSRLIKVTATVKNRRTQGKSATAHMNKCNKSKKNKPSNGIHCLFKQICTLVLTLSSLSEIKKKNTKVSWGGTCALSLRTIPAWTMNRADYADLIFWDEKSSHFCCQDAADFIQTWMRASPTCCHTAVIHVALYTPDCAESAAWNRDKLNKCGPGRACSLPRWVEHNPFKDLRCTSHTHTHHHTHIYR